jgi:ribosome biogenesis protein ERB1
MNVDPESLLPKLPSPRDLQPFPTKMGVVYQGHTGKILSLSVDPSGQFLCTASEDKTVCFWEILTGRCLKVSADLYLDGVV